MKIIQSLREKNPLRMIISYKKLFETIMGNILHKSYSYTQHKKSKLSPHRSAIMTTKHSNFHISITEINLSLGT